MLRPILVLSSWSTGSSAVTGFLGECGAFLAPPYALAYDPKTPSTFESEDFRQMLLATIGELTLEYKVDTKIFRHAFKPWLNKKLLEAKELGFRTVALKHPLSAFLLHEIDAVCDPIYVVVTRPFAEIEETRKRRGWHAVYGERGASAVYDRIYNFLHQNDKQFISIPYMAFMTSHEVRSKVLDFCDLDVTDRHAHEAFARILERPQS